MMQVDPDLEYAREKAMDKFCEWLSWSHHLDQYDIHLEEQWILGCDDIEELNKTHDHYSQSCQHYLMNKLIYGIKS